jgi:hypothetical protein
MAKLKDTPGTFREVLGVFYSHASPVVLSLYALTAWSIRLTLGDWGAVDVLVLAGMIALWPLQEWCIHVFILHSKPFTIRGRTFDLANARKHRAHHKDPWNIGILFVPMYTVIPAGVLQLVLWNLLLPTPVAFTVISAYFTMSLHYEWSHYLAHVRWRPPGRHYQVIVDSHRRHHFKNESQWWGVSMLMADRILGTAPDVGDVSASPTVRTLGFEPQNA